MTLYEVQRYIFDTLRQLERAGGERPALQGYDLTGTEMAALDSVDVVKLFSAGVHPVLIQQFGRASGLTTEDLRRELTKLDVNVERTARWQT